MQITEQTIVADIAAELPSSIRIFQRHGIDFCCGGKRPLGAVCRDQGIAFDEVAKAIEASAAADPHDDRDWTRAPLHELIDHIVVTYHDVLREELPRLEAMAAKVDRVHGANAPYLARVHDIVSELSSELGSHMHKEEVVLFPAIAGLERGGARAPLPIAMPITAMEHEHDHAGALLAESRSLTGGYEPPEWACQTFRALYDGMAELESAMHVHVHLENNVLFPRALALTEVERVR